MRIVIADSNSSYRAFMRRALNSQSDLIVVAEAMDCDDVVEAVRIHRPEAVLLDIDLPGPNGLEAIRRIKEPFPRVAVVMVSKIDAPTYREAAAHCGADVFLSKFAPLSILISAVRQFRLEKAA